jgi:protein-tyrosine phosphatase
MRDMHCHILPGVDDGARNMDESLAMLDAAVDAGVTSIVCTPHCREPWFDFDKMWNAYDAFTAEAQHKYPALYIGMAFEVNYRTLEKIGFEWAHDLGFAGSNEFLLELSNSAPRSKYADYERLVFKLQSMGFEVIIAHPERYHAIQEDLELAWQFKEMGCKLQASADFIAGGRGADSKKPAIALFKEGLYDYIASDAHNPKHYKLLQKAVKKYGNPAGS